MDEETVYRIWLIDSIFVGDVRAKGSPRRMPRILHTHLENRRFSKVSFADHPTPHRWGRTLPRPLESKAYRRYFILWFVTW
jgi:hypothetical protein